MDAKFADGHCDLLYYAAGKQGRTVNDPDANCSLPQLSQGGVGLQTLAVFTSTSPGSSRSASAQLDVFEQLHVPNIDFSHLLDGDTFRGLTKPQVVIAIENGSGLAEEDEPFEVVERRLREIRAQFSPVLYVSLTHNDLNRFGGGNRSTAGLTEDGRKLLALMKELEIPVDLSHASDSLAMDILREAEVLDLPVLISHTGFRSVHDMRLTEGDDRMVPDEIAQEVIRRGGIVGLFMVTRLLGGTDQNAYQKHFEHALTLDDSEKALCLGCDFFGSEDVPHYPPGYQVFLKECRNAGQMGNFLPQFFDSLGIEDPFRTDFARNNLLRFLARVEAVQT